MKITRKHLNLVLLQLPDPRLAFAGKILDNIRIPVCEPMQIIPDYDPRKHGESVQIYELEFRFDYKEMDWILWNLDL